VEKKVAAVARNIITTTTITITTILPFVGTIFSTSMT